MRLVIPCLRALLPVFANRFELRDGQIAKTDPQRVTQALVNRIMPGMTVERALKELSTRVGGKGVQIAVDNVNHLIAPSIVAARINAAKIDSLQGLKKLDGIMFDLELALAETKKMYSTMNRFFGLTKEQGTALDAKLARVSFDGKENRLGWTPAMFDWIFTPKAVPRSIMSSRTRIRSNGSINT
jgi:hypothetical protein